MRLRHDSSWIHNKNHAFHAFSFLELFLRLFVCLFLPCFCFVLSCFCFRLAILFNIKVSSDRKSRASTSIASIVNIVRSVRMVSHANVVIVPITKFSIVIGSPRAYLSRNWRNWCPIWTFHASYVPFDGFLYNFSYSFQRLWKELQTFSLKGSSQKTLLTPNFVIDTINW